MSNSAAEQFFTAIGLMSGTSADGVDAALVQIGTGFPPKIELIEFVSIGFPDDLRRRVLIACGDPGATIAEICSLHCIVSEAFAFALLAWGNLQGEATYVPTATGASREAVLGTITPGKNFRHYSKSFT
jgi:1,6-anhydro-N-acetylmuramate kinase